MAGDAIGRQAGRRLQPSRERRRPGSGSRDAGTGQGAAVSGDPRRFRKSGEASVSSRPRSVRSECVRRANSSRTSERDPLRRVHSAARRPSLLTAEKTTFIPRGSRTRSPVAPAGTRQSPQDNARKALLSLRIPAYSGRARKGPIRPEILAGPRAKSPALAGNPRLTRSGPQAPRPACHAGGRGFESRRSQKIPVNWHASLPSEAQTTAGLHASRAHPAQESRREPVAAGDLRYRCRWSARPAVTRTARPENEAAGHVT